ncbi:hypothetical protein K8B33_09525 [Alcanivorax sp. JB21]|uniref:hypothetical protein n=1 Tax=Alcanivorax limicola TaxID=2874102 RepID=UPI001CBC4F03|nr:hypothetical protein [Alcanivorax limicola]MBZ2189337.1 hypothetical protein [Alcanivorax limicola]
MSAYHALLSHFPVALWITATLIIVWRSLSAATLAQAAARLLPLLLLWAALMGLITFSAGLLIWPLEAVSASPLARNHLLAASWTLAYWVLLLALCWRGGNLIWHGSWRLLMPALALIGVTLLGVTGALGGHLIGNPTMIGSLLRALGWEIYTTFYLPGWMLVLTLAGALLFLGLAWLWRPRPTTTTRGGPQP